jgi:iron(III) transport system permease protein
VTLGLLLAYGLRLSSGRGFRLATRIAALGYAIPGSVVAVAVVVPLAWADNTWIDPVWGTGLLLSGSGFALVYAYLVRFLAVALSGAESGLATVSPELDQASRGLGAGPAGTLLRVHAPLAGASVLAGGLLVFIDVLKELPASLLLRPASGATLAVRVHQYVSQESLHLAALPALAIVLTGLIPVLLLTKGIRAASGPVTST